MQKQFTLSVLILLVGVCSSIGQTTANDSIFHDGAYRHFITYTPSGIQGGEQAPLLLGFHGYGGNAAQFMLYSGFREIADTAKFILVYPQGEPDQTQTNHWNVGGWTVNSTVDDIGFVDALLDSLIATKPVDTSRIYSTGMSNGGFMSYVLACELNHRIAAIASVTGSMTPQTYTSCNPVHPTPILQIHGDADNTVPYNGTWFSESIPDVIQYWRNQNYLIHPATVTPLPDTNPNDGSTVEHHVYSGGHQNVNAELFLVLGGGHDWPGAFGNMDISANLEVWKFLSRYQMASRGQVGLEDLGEGKINILGNPVTDILQVEGLQAGDYTIMNIQGQTLSNISVNGDFCHEVSRLKSGTYLIVGQGHRLKFLKQ